MGETGCDIWGKGVSRASRCLRIDLLRLFEPPLAHAHGAEPRGRVRIARLRLEDRTEDLRRLVEVHRALLLVAPLERLPIRHLQLHVAERERRVRIPPALLARRARAEHLQKKKK